MKRRIAIAIIVILLLMAAVDAVVLKGLGIWGAINSPVKAMLLGVLLLFNIFSLPLGLVVLILKLPTRRNRGLCPRCAYDLRYEYENGCPECGWGREPRPQTEKI